MVSTVTERSPRPGVTPTGPGRLAGVLAVGASLGVSHLVAGVVDPPSSPYLAVGKSFIDLTPAWLKDAAIAVFGGYDKVALLVGMALVLVAVGAGVGLLARRDLRLGLAALGLLGAVGLVAVLTRPDTAAVGVLAPFSAVAAGAVALVLLHRPRARGAAAGPELDRRTALGIGAGAVVAAGLGQVAARAAVDVGASQAAVGALVPDVALDPVPVGADFVADGGLPFTTSNADFYRIDTALSPPRLSAADWRLRVHGMVEKEITLDFAQLVARPLVEQRVTLTCVSYELGGDLVGTADWVGVSLRDLLLEAGIQPGADQVFATSADGFTASTPVDVVMEVDRGALLAVNMNGEPLPLEHGFPVRMIVPGLYGFVSATKWITDLELTTFAAKEAYWTPRGWSDRGPIKTASKFTSASSTVSDGRYRITATGAAWAQHVGISGVEVQADDGEWVAARMAADVGPDTWRMWRVDLPGLGEGDHVLRCRATRADGELQTSDVVAPAPDGASGWHTVTVRGA